MRMDIGLYDLQVRASSESGYAWLVEPALAVDGDLARTYPLDPPIAVEGLLQASDGTAVTDALIRAYVLTNDGSSSRPVQVAETMSDDQGNYRLLIAPHFGAQ